MSGVFSRDGLKVLKFSYGVAVVGILLASAAVGLSYYYLQQEKNNDITSQKLAGEIGSRLDGARRERDLLKDSAQLFTQLKSDGIFIAEKRLDLIETLQSLRLRHKLIGLEFELMPQRKLKLPDGGNYSQIEINASNIKMKAFAYHDGDLLAFLDEFSRMNRGFFPLESCTIIRKNDTPQIEPSETPSFGIGSVIDKINKLDRTLSPASVAVASQAPALLSPGLEADCVLDWITLAEKGAEAGTNGNGSTNSQPGQ